MPLRPATMLAVLIPVATCLAADSVDDVLAGLDRTAPTFHAFSADLTSVTYTAVIQESVTEKGSMRLKRNKREMTMLVEFSPPNRKSVAVHGQKLEIYYPEQQTIEEYDIARYRAAFDQFMLVGFGTSGKELAQAYDVKLVGAETVAGVEACHLELVPKSAEALKNLKKLELWIAASQPYAVQQKIYLAGGDYRLFTYTNVKLNRPLSESDLKLRVPGNTKRTSPQS